MGKVLIPVLLFLIKFGERVLPFWYVVDSDDQIAIFPIKQRIMTCMKLVS